MLVRASLAPLCHRIFVREAIIIRNSIMRYTGAGITFAALFILAISPEHSAQAVREALTLCAELILPSLLPFFLISGLIISLGLGEDLARVLQKFFQNRLRINAYACVPLVLSLLGGYPVGAAALAEIVKSGKLNMSDAEKLLPFCNNTGPAFIIGAVGTGIFSSNSVGFLLYVSHAAAAIILLLIFARDKKSQLNEICNSDVDRPGIIAALPMAVKGAIDKCLNICGFMIFFSVLNSILKDLGILDSLALYISRVFSLEISFSRCIISGIMELGSGIAGMSALPGRSSSYALAAFILGFGSLSVHCQTLALVNEAGIKCARHFAGRILHGLLSAVLVYVISEIFKI